MLTVFDDMIADMEANEKWSPIVSEMFLIGRKPNISLVLYHNLMPRCQRLQD